MLYTLRRISALVFISASLIAPQLARAQAAPSAATGTVTGTVTDASGAVIPSASVTLRSTTGYNRTAPADASGSFTFSSLPFGSYTLSVRQKGFQLSTQQLSVQSPAVINKTVALSIAAATQTITVAASTNDQLQQSISDQTDVTTDTSRLPLISSSTGVASAITLSSPGVTADSNGMFHPLGEHSDTTYSIDGQPISDQQSKTFANQISLHAIQSMQVIEGVIPPEYGDKASLVARTTTKSGLSTPKANGSVQTTYGSFGSTDVNASVGIGNSKYGNFFTGDINNSGRYLDSPEIVPFHDHGNSESFFDRIDFDPNSINTYHLNLTASRSWFQVPNQYDQQALGQDQRSQIFSFNVAPFWTRVFGQTGVLEVNPYIRQDNVHYYPSHDIFHDTPATLSQDRSLRNLGIKIDYTLSKGINNAKFGFDINHTFLNENFGVGITSPTYNAVCVDSQGNPVPAPGVTQTSQCAAAGYSPNPSFQPGLLPYDLTRGGSLFRFHGRTDIKEEDLYAQDSITTGNWKFLIGARGDNYNGITRKYMLEPRAGITYNLARTRTVLRVGYSRLMPTPYNENLVLSSSTGSGGLAQDTGSFGQHPLTPGVRNQYDVGFEQSVTKHLIVDGDYFWKETKGDYDFDVLLNTPLTFPIQWRKSKIDGFDLRLTMPLYHGLSVNTVMGHSRARFFGPESGGILFNNPNSGLSSYAPFRIDHDQAFEQTTSLNYQPSARGPWYGFTWRYDSGMVAGNAPYATDNTTPVSLTYLTPDQQQQIELTCGGVRATLNNPLTSCAPNELSSPLLTIPAPGTFNPDRNPQRIAPRNLFDMSAGWDNFLRADRYKLDASLSVTNVTNKVALYNFLSTFSGTHFVPPRAYTAGLTLNF
jgi:Carboxypeptidase regulatory-like domain